MHKVFIYILDQTFRISVIAQILCAWSFARISMSENFPERTNFKVGKSRLYEEHLNDSDPILAFLFAC